MHNQNTNKKGKVANDSASNAQPSNSNSKNS